MAAFSKESRTDNILNMRYLFIAISWTLSFILQKKKIVYFCSFYGQYNDNPKYISLKLHELYPEYNIIWAHSILCHELLPDYVKKAEFRSFMHYFYVYNAKVVVDNYLGLRSFTGKPKGVMSYVYKLLSKKNNRQLNISTWHGTPLKKIGADSLDFKTNDIFYSNIDYSISGCCFTKTSIAQAFRDVFNIKEYGTPRNDILISGYDTNEVKKKLKLPRKKKVALYAPTFRNDTGQENLSQLNQIGVDSLLSTLSNRFGGEWVVACRFHNHIVRNLQSNNVFNDKVINGNIGDDMTEYLLCADVLITDFSSSFFDFALTKKPCFLFATDLKNYSENERGLYFSYLDLPFPTSQTPKELYYQIINFDENIYESNVCSFLKLLGNYEDGYASTKIVNDIMEFMTRGIKPVI